MKLGGDEALRALGFKAPEISPNYSQTIEIEDVKDLAYAARFAFRVLKKVYRVSDFSSATFKERVPSALVLILLWKQRNRPRAKRRHTSYL